MKSLLNKDIVKNNELFSHEQIAQLLVAFEHFVDPWTKQMNIRTMLSCASTLGLDEKYPTIMRILQDINQKQPNLSYEDFLQEVTERLGNVRTEKGRAVLFDLLDQDNKGIVYFDNFKKMAKELGHVISDDDLEEIVNSMSKKEGVTKEDFERYLAHKLNRNL